MDSTEDHREITSGVIRQLSGKTITGQELAASFRHATRVIADHREQLNALNVFPVPDGDTGTNMALTMKFAIDAVDLHQLATPSADVVAAKLARGSLMGARGNSGVILSQILRGFSSAIDGCNQLRAEDVARGFETASKVAYKAVINPVEGTMLTVVSDAASSARIACDATGDVLDVFDAAADGAGTSLAHTPELLAVLRQAQVVDAGGQGIAYMLRAIANHLRGNLDDIHIGDLHPRPTFANLNSSGNDHRFDDSGYCTNFVVFGNDIDLEGVRTGFDRIGTSVVVIGDQSVLKIHIHTDRPDQALALGLRFGALDRVSIDNMDRQIEEVAASFNQQSQSTMLTSEIEGKHAIVALAQGEGLARALLSLGATTVIQIHEDALPCIDQLVRAVESADSADVLVLPNDQNLLKHAEQLPELTGKRVAVVPSASFSAGLSAIGAMSLAADIGANFLRMTSALTQVRSIELAISEEDATVAERVVPAGFVRLYLAGTYDSAAPDLDTALTNGFRKIGPISPDLCTVFAGRDATVSERGQVRNRLEHAFPETEIEVIEGGQAYHRFIIMFD